jgi:hypothetical protein
MSFIYLSVFIAPAAAQSPTWGLKMGKYKPRILIEKIKIKFKLFSVENFEKGFNCSFSAKILYILETKFQ